MSNCDTCKFALAPSEKEPCHSCDFTYSNFEPDTQRSAPSELERLREENAELRKLVLLADKIAQVQHVIFDVSEDRIHTMLIDRIEAYSRARKDLDNATR